MPWISLRDWSRADRLTLVAIILALAGTIVATLEYLHMREAFPLSNHSTEQHGISKMLSVFADLYAAVAISFAILTALSVIYIIRLRFSVRRIARNNMQLRSSLENHEQELGKLQNVAAENAAAVSAMEAIRRDYQGALLAERAENALLRERISEISGEVKSLADKMGLEVDLPRLQNAQSSATTARRLFWR